MTPDSIRRVQEGKVFDYQEPVAVERIDGDTGEILQLLIEQAADDADLPVPKTRKVKAGKAVIEVPVTPPEVPQTNLSLLRERPNVDIPLLIEWILAHPGATHAEISTAYGRPAGWFSTVWVMPEFQAALDPHRASLTNPSLTATIAERFQGLLIRSLDVVQTKLSGPVPDVNLAMEAAKLGVRALGLGANGGPGNSAPAPQSLESLAERLTGLITSKQKGSAIGHVPQATNFVEDVTPKGKV